MANEVTEGRQERRERIEPIGTKETQTPGIVAYVPLVRITAEDRVVLREGSTRSSPWLGTIDSGPPGRGYIVGSCLSSEIFPSKDDGMGLVELKR